MAAAFAAACEAGSDAPQPGPEPDLQGATLVVGTTVDQWSLVSVPMAGGVAEARDLANPTRVVWTGRTELPASIEAHGLRSGRILLRTAEGALHSYDPSADILVQVAEVSPEATWAGNASVGLYLGSEGALVEIAADGVWRYSVDREVAWAAPAEGGVLVALEGDSDQRDIWLLRRDEDAPVETGAADVGTPAIVTAWGRRAVFTARSATGIVVLTVSPIERAGELDLDSPITAMSASPSTHEIYLALDAPPRLVAVNRFNLSSRTVGDLSRVTDDIRPAIFGDGILVAQEGSVVRWPVSGGTPSRIPADWRADLPVGLPGGAVLAISDGAVLVVGADREPVTVLEDASPDRWWLPMQWNPARAAVTADRITDGDTRAPEADVQAGDAQPEPGGDRAAEAVPESRETAPAPVAAGPPPGFYAIVGSARQPEGIRELLRSLEDAGFATQIQSYPDEAGRTWTRGLVGPYRSRSEAEAAARQLLRERRLEAWVTEIAVERRTREEPI